MRWLRDPFILMLILGGALYFVLTTFRPEGPDENIIIVDQDHLLYFIQERSKAFEPQAARALLKDMSSEEFERLVKQYTTEEALYRRARLLGLDESDYVIRLRMVQKYEFLLETSLDDVTLDLREVRDYFYANRANYQNPAVISFEHVFFANKIGVNTRQTAQTLLNDLNAGRNEKNRWNTSGELFPYQKNYNLRTKPLIQSHFGEDFARAIFTEKFTLGGWQGPLKSSHGWHLINISQRRDLSDPEFDAIQARVKEDYSHARKKQQIDALMETLVSEFEIQISGDIKARIGKTP